MDASSAALKLELLTEFLIQKFNYISESVIAVYE